MVQSPKTQCSRDAPPSHVTAVTNTTGRPENATQASQARFLAVVLLLEQQDRLDDGQGRETHRPEQAGHLAFYTVVKSGPHGRHRDLDEGTRFANEIPAAVGNMPRRSWYPQPSGDIEDPLVSDFFGAWQTSGA